MFKKILGVVAILLIFVAAVLAISTISSALAAISTLRVNSLEDNVDANPGDGICADSSGACTLRAAIMESNEIFGTNQIEFDVSGTITITSETNEDFALDGDLDIRGDLTVKGNKAITIDGNNQGSVFDIVSGSVILDGLTIQNSFDAVYSSSSGTLTIENSIITKNKGVAIATINSLTIRNSTISENSITDTHVATIYVGAGDKFIVENSTISGNVNDFHGGIFAIANNVAITNSTISGNSGLGTSVASPPFGIGGAVLAYSKGLVLNGVTIANNIGTRVGGITIIPGFNSSTNVTNTILDNNKVGSVSQNCDNIYPLISSGYNISSDGTCGLNQIGDLNNTNPILQPLALNSNPNGVYTHALGVLSPAVNAGNPNNSLSNDQRGVTRPQGGGYDIGSFESEVVGPSIKFENVHIPQEAYLDVPFDVEFEVINDGDESFPGVGVSISSLWQFSPTERLLIWPESYAIKYSTGEIITGTDFPIGSPYITGVSSNIELLPGQKVNFTITFKSTSATVLGDIANPRFMAIVDSPSLGEELLISTTSDILFVENSTPLPTETPSPTPTLEDVVITEVIAHDCTAESSCDGTTVLEVNGENFTEGSRVRLIVGDSEITGNYTGGDGKTKILTDFQDLVECQEYTVQVYSSDSDNVTETQFIYNPNDSCVVPTPDPTPTPEPTNEPLETPTPEPTNTPQGGSSSSSSAGGSSCNNVSPTAPYLSVIAGTNSVRLSWNDLPNTTHYMVRYGTTPGRYIYGVSNTGDVLAFDVKSLTPGLTYYFQVAGVNDCSGGSWSNEISAATGSILTASVDTEIDSVDDVQGTKDEQESSTILENVNTNCSDVYYLWWMPLLIQLIASLGYCFYLRRKGRVSLLSLWPVALFAILSQTIHSILGCNCAVGVWCERYLLLNVGIVISSSISSISPKKTK